MTAVLPPLVAGLVLGFLGHLMMPTGPAQGLLHTLLWAVADALLASYAGAALGLYLPGHWGDWLASWLGAVMLMALARRASNG